MKNKIFSSLIAALAFSVFATPSVKAQPQDLVNVVDFDLTEIITCVPNDAIPAVICNSLLDLLLDDLVRAEAFIDQVFAGYREDIPRFIRNQLDEPVFIRIRMVEEDGPFNTLAFVAPGEDIQIDFAPPPFFQIFSNYRAWSVTRVSTVNLDVDDVVFLLVTDGLVSTVVHEVMHSLGHPRNFEMADLNRPINMFGQINFLGDRFGVNRVGYGLSQFRGTPANPGESGNPFATFIPLSTTDGAGHLNPLSPAFFRPDDSLQDLFLPTAAGPGVQDFMSRSLRGMFADLAFKIRGINAPGIIDIDGDGMMDEPLLVSPDLPTDP